MIRNLPSKMLKEMTKEMKRRTIIRTTITAMKGDIEKTYHHE